MTLNRIVLRLAAQAALLNFHRDKNAYPTLAKDKVFDSRIDPQETTEGAPAYPICVLYTDYDKDFVKIGSRAHSKRMLTLTIEILMVQMEQAVGVDAEGNEVDAGFVLTSPLTDSEMEISLDIFEDQVFKAMFTAENSAADCVRSLVLGYENVISRRGASAEGGQRLSARQVTIEADVPRDPLDGVLPPYVATFLDDLAASELTPDRGAMIRDYYLAGAALSDSEKRIRSLAMASRVAEILAQPRGPAVYLGTPVVWLAADGGPLP